MCIPCQLPEDSRHLQRTETQPSKGCASSALIPEHWGISRALCHPKLTVRARKARGREGERVGSKTHSVIHTFSLYPWVIEEGAELTGTDILQEPLSVCACVLPKRRKEICNFTIYELFVRIFILFFVFFLFTEKNYNLFQKVTNFNSCPWYVASLTILLKPLEMEMRQKHDWKSAFAKWGLELSLSLMISWIEKLHALIEAMINF